MFLFALSPITEGILCFAVLATLPILFVATLVLLFKKAPVAAAATPRPLAQSEIPDAVANAQPAQPRARVNAQPPTPPMPDPIKDATVAYQKLEEVAVYLASQNADPAQIGAMFTTFVSRKQPKPVS